MKLRGSSLRGYNMILSYLHQKRDVQKLAPVLYNTDWIDLFN